MSRFVGLVKVIIMRRFTTCKSMADSGPNLKLTQRNKARYLSTSMLVKSGVFTAALSLFAGQAYAQTCTPEVLFQSASSFEGRNAAGSAAGFDASNVQTGDFVVFEDAVVADYNTGATIDVVMEITGIDRNSATPPHSTDSGNVTLGSNGVLSLSNGISRSDPYVTFRLLPMRGGSVTSNVASGEQLSLQNAIVSLQDVDSAGDTQDNSDIAGISNANPGSPTITRNATVLLGFQNGGGPAGFTAYADTPTTTSPLSWRVEPGGGFTDHTVDLAYANYTGGEFLHGFTGTTTNTHNRGGVFAMCGEIAEPGLTTGAKPERYDKCYI